MMLHDQSVMFAPCHMIAVMTDDSLYIGSLCCRGGAQQI